MDPNPLLTLPSTFLQVQFLDVQPISSVPYGTTLICEYELDVFRLHQIHVSVKETRNQQPVDSPDTFNAYHRIKTMGRRYSILSSRRGIGVDWYLLPRGFNPCILRCITKYFRSMGGVHACLCWPHDGLSWPEFADLIPSRCISKSPVEDGGWFVSLCFSKPNEYDIASVHQDEHCPYIVTEHEHCLYIVTEDESLSKITSIYCSAPRLWIRPDDDSPAPPTAG